MSIHTLAPESEFRNLTSLSPTDFLSHHPHIKRLIASAMVFRTTQTPYEPQTLLIRRDPADSYPCRWEIAGGQVEVENKGKDGNDVENWQNEKDEENKYDATVEAAAARELREETGLTVKSVLFPVGMLPINLDDRPSLKRLGITAERDNARNEGDPAQTVTFIESGQTWGKVTLGVDVHEDLDDPASIKLQNGEHDKWAWATEGEVRNAQWKDGRDIEFVSEGVWRTIMEGFRVRNEKEAQRLMRRFPGRAINGPNHLWKG